MPLLIISLCMATLNAWVYTPNPVTSVPQLPAVKARAITPGANAPMGSYPALLDLTKVGVAAEPQSLLCWHLPMRAIKGGREPVSLSLLRCLRLLFSWLRLLLALADLQSLW